MAFLVCIPIASAMAIAFNKRIEESIPVAIFAATFVTYLCGILGVLTFAPIMVAILAVLGLGYTGYGLIKERSVKRYLTFGGVMFLALGAYYGLVCRGRMMAEQDDLLVYGKQVLDFFLVGRICRYQYIPGMMMWEYLSERFWPVFSESILFWAVAMLCVSMLLAIFSDNERKPLYHYVFVALFIVILPLITKNRDSYFLLQNDFVMGLNVAYIICMYQRFKDSGERFYEIAILTGLAFLTLTKVTGLLLALIVILLLFGFEIVDNTDKFSLGKIALVLKCMGAVAVAKASWSIFVKSMSGREKFSGIRVYITGIILKRWYLLALAIISIAIMLVILKKIVISHNLKAYTLILLIGAATVFGGTYFIMSAEIRNDALKNFISVIISTYAPDRYFGFGYRFYVPYIVLFIALMFVWMMLVSVSDGYGEKTGRIVLITNIGLILFTAFLFLSNNMTRGVSQVSRAKECERYIYAYVICYIVVFVRQFVLIEKEKAQTYKLIAIFGTIFLFLVGNTAGIVTQVFAQNDFYNFDGLNYITINENDKFFYVDQKGELNYSRFDYRISPATMVNYYFSDMKIDGYWLGNDEEERYLTTQEWNDILADCTYVYVAATNDDFADMYGEFFEDEIIDGHIYNVNVTDGMVRLTSIDY